ncbi:hypothetical protein C8R45DRAFT_90984 [Mycena sanguinolenta]|nr:hypothetical protein C8R45DRAFT_90984 [Mycena sanguinolenta]
MDGPYRPPIPLCRIGAGTKPGSGTIAAGAGTRRPRARVAIEARAHCRSRASLLMRFRPCHSLAFPFSSHRHHVLLLDVDGTDGEGAMGLGTSTEGYQPARRLVAARGWMAELRRRVRGVRRGDEDAARARTTVFLIALIAIRIAGVRPVCEDGAPPRRDGTADDDARARTIAYSSSASGRLLGATFAFGFYIAGVREACASSSGRDPDEARHGHAPDWDPDYN